MKYLIKLLMAMALAMVGFQAQATLVINQSDCGAIECIYGDQTSTAVINDVIEEYLADMYSITEVYKSEVPMVGGDPIPDSIVGVDEKSFANSYDTTFSNTSTDPTEAWIEYVAGEAIIDCPSCWLLVKDGDHSPAWYLFNISDWTGVEAIHLQGFWSSGGAISHVSIYGGPPGTSVPAPGPLGLLTIGLLLSGIRRLKSTTQSVP
jgi:hypothetical protein